MTTEIKITSKIELLIEDAIKKCQTYAHVTKTKAGELRHDGFNGFSVKELIESAELCLKYAHAYQDYMNVFNSGETVFDEIEKVIV